MPLKNRCENKFVIFQDQKLGKVQVEEKIKRKQKGAEVFRVLYGVCTSLLLAFASG